MPGAFSIGGNGAGAAKTATKTARVIIRRRRSDGTVRDRCDNRCRGAARWASTGRRFDHDCRTVWGKMAGPGDRKSAVDRRVARCMSDSRRSDIRGPGVPHKRGGDDHHQGHPEKRGAKQNWGRTDGQRLVDRCGRQSTIPSPGRRRSVAPDESFLIALGPDIGGGQALPQAEFYKRRSIVLTVARGGGALIAMSVPDVVIRRPAGRTPWGFCGTGCASGYAQFPVVIQFEI
jgi:hypothetical protein